MSLLPSASQLDTWTSVREAAEWASVDDGLLRSMNRQLGDPNIDSLQVLGVIPADILRGAVNQATRGTRSLTAVEKAQLVLMLNAIRHKYGLPPLHQGSAAASSTSMPSGAATGSTNKIKIKLNQVIDQGSDVEIEQLDQVALQRARRLYVHSEGDAPLEKEEVTDSQLSCLAAQINLGLAPFVDMGVWGPYGERLARQMKFTSQVLKDGQWKSVEIPGAASVKAWEESWRIFRTAAIMLNVASSAVLDRYSTEFKQRVSEYPDCWHIGAQADIRCRSEWWPAEKRRQEEFHAAHPQLSAYNTGQPWNSVIKASANNQEFWHKEFEKQALLYQLNGPKAMRAAPEPPRATGFTPGSSTDKRPHEPRRRDGRYFKSREGVNIHYDWSRQEDGCTNDGPCPKGMAHVCEWCRQPHRAIHCPQVPGWTEDKSDRGKGKGKGGNRSRGRGPKRQRHM